MPGEGLAAWEERLGYELPDIVGTYSHISPAMVKQIVDGLQRLGEKAFKERAKIAGGRSPMPLLDELLTLHRNLVSEDLSQTRFSTLGNGPVSAGGRYWYRTSGPSLVKRIGENRDLHGYLPQPGHIVRGSAPLSRNVMVSVIQMVTQGGHV